MPYDGTEYTGDPILAVIDRVDQLICDEAHWGHKTDQQAPEPSRAKVWQDPDVHCPVTALWACGIGDWEGPEFSYFTKAVLAIDPAYDFDSIPTYNDAKCRTFPDIKALIRKARELRLADIMGTVDAI